MSVDMRGLALALLGLCLFSVGSFAQCGDELMKKALSDMGDKQYIKDFDVKLSAASSKIGSRFTVVLNSRTTYQLNIANGAANSESVIVQIFDGDRLLGSNFANSKTFDRFQFVCSKTGPYRLNVYCNGGGDVCARVVLSLVNQLAAAEMPM